MNRRNFAQNAVWRIGRVAVVVALVTSLGFLVSGPWVTAQESAEPAPTPRATPKLGDVAPEPFPASPEHGEQEWDDYLHVVGTVPLEGQLLQDQLVVFFSEPVQWERVSGPPVTAEPEGILSRIERSDTYIRFPLDDPPDDLVVTLRFQDRLRSVSGKRLNPADREFVFTRIDFRPNRVFLDERTAETTRLGVLFPAPVDAEMLRRHLSIETERGDDVPFTVDPTDDGVLHRVTIRDHQDWPVWLRVAEGVQDRSGRLTQHEAARFQYPTELTLGVSNVRWASFSPDYQEIAMQFSQAVEPDTLEEHLRVLDSRTGEDVYFYISTYEPTEQHTIGLSIDTPGAIDLELVFEAGLMGAEGAELRRPYRATLHHVPAPLRLQDHWWSSHPPEEGLGLQVRFTQSIEAPELEKQLCIEPEVANFRIEPQGYRAYRIYGDWNSLQNYTLFLDEGFAYGDGQTLNEPIRLTVRTPEVPAFVGFGYDGQFYFPRRAGAPLAMTTRNVAKVDLTLHRMFPSNLAVALDDLDADGASSRFVGTWSEKLASTTVEVAPRRDRPVETEVDLESLFLTNRRGVFSLQGRDPDSGHQTNKLVVWTDIGLLAHWQDDELAVFAHDLFSLEPRAFADVRVYSSKNQLLGQSRTGADGMAQLGNFNPSHGVPKVVVVEHEEDFTFLELERRTDDPVAFTGSMPAYDRKGYDAFIYADRNLYRPGETAHLHWSVRTNYGDALAHAPLLLRVRRPNGRILVEEPTTLSEWGSGGFDLETQRAYPTGRYTIELYVPGKETPIGSYTLNLEDFVPNRIRVDVDAPEGPYVAGTEHEVTVQAEHLFGAPSADRKAELAVVFDKSDFASDRWPGYRFGNDDEYTEEVVPFGEAQTDGEGQATFTFAYEHRPEVTFPLKATLVGRVFELGGRAVAGTAERTLLPETIMLGLNVTPAVDGSSVEVNALAIQSDESPADLDAVFITLERQTWSYHLRRYYSHHEPNWAPAYEPIETRELALSDGRGTAVFDVPRFGQYRVRVHLDETRQYSALAFYRMWDRIQIVDAVRPSLITVTTDRERYAVGDVAEVKIESPFDGTGIMVVQGESIQQMVAITIEDGVGRAQFDVTRAQFPNVWVEATVIHAIEDDRSQVYPFSSFAMAPIAVDDPDRKIEVVFRELSEEIRPAGLATFAIETRDASGAPVEAEVTLAAVDEGIHLVTNYQSPAPYDWLARFRRPDFRRAHYYDRVAYDFGKPPPGGGLDALLGRRSAPPDENWIRPIALWSGVVRTDNEGRAEVTFDVPEFTGQLRLVAVAVNAGALGAENAHVYVRRPYMMRIAMPRFLLPGDTMQARATVFNSAEAAVRAQVRWTGSGVLEGEGGSGELEVHPGGEASVWADFTTAQAVGQGSIRWEAEIFDDDGEVIEQLIEEMPLPVRPPAAYQSHYEQLSIEPGAGRTFRVTRFIDDDRAEIGVVVGANPLLRLTRALDFVAGYPYGCVEQQVSRMFPLYLLRRNARLFQIALNEESAHDEQMTIEDAESLRVFIEAGIQRLMAMQTPDGGLAMWPGGMTSYDYGSVYALHFLTLVKSDREYDLPESSFRSLQDYVRRMARDWTGEGMSDHYLRAYALYALALDGDIEAIDQIGRFDNITLPTSARFLLAAALARTTQDSARINLYLSSRPHEAHAVSEPSGVLITDIRNKAVQLMALQEMDGDRGQRQALADELIRFLDERGRGTTQETAFVTAALVRYLEDIEADIDQAGATITGPEGDAHISGREVFHGLHEGAGGVFEVENTGTAPLYVTVTTRGVPPSPNLEPIREGFTIERTLYTRRGVPLEGDAARTFAQSESMVVGITITPQRRAEQVVVVDLLPAGFEIENPRLDADAIPGAAFEGAITPSHLDVRDDRLVLAFEELSADTHHFYYVVRAVTPGVFQHPPVDGECMYDPAVRGATAPSSIRIQ